MQIGAACRYQSDFVVEAATVLLELKTCPPPCAATAASRWSFVTFEPLDLIKMHSILTLPQFSERKIALFLFTCQEPTDNPGRFL
jgi:hypothetical protein